MDDTKDEPPPITIHVIGNRPEYRTEYTREQRHTDLFLPPSLRKGDEPDKHPIERATHLDGNVRMVVRSRMQSHRQVLRHQVDWTLDDLERAIEMLTYIRDSLVEV